jgi:hypothetical protein
VDDLKISCKEEESVDEVIESLRMTYSAVNVNEGKILPYLGMTLDFSRDGVCTIGMKDVIEELLEAEGITGCVATPAAPDLFKIEAASPECPQLTGKDKSRFYSTVQKLLYIAKRTRPDILTAISFLTTRFQSPVKTDATKLQRVLKYLNGTKDLTLSLSSSDPVQLTSYVDASFAVHDDFKSHTGAVSTIGAGAITSRSVKQKLVTASSTEAELVACADEALRVTWSADFMSHQGIDVRPVTIMQDNQSAIKLSTKGKSTNRRTKHISLRYFIVKDKIEDGLLRLQYVRSEDMLADFLTKPLQGKLFKTLRDKILNTVYKT